MIKNLTTLEVTIDNKIYKLLCEVDSPIGAVHDALQQMKAFVVGKINDANNAEQPKAVEPAEVITTP